MLESNIQSQLKNANIENRLTTKLPKPLNPPSLFNGYVGANLAFAYDRIGLFQIFGAKQKLSFDDIALSTKSIPQRVKALLRAGRALGFIAIDDDGFYSLTKAGEEVAQNIGYFTWSIGGYGDFFKQLGSLAMTDSSWSDLRNGKMVALGSDQVNSAFMSEILFNVLDDIEFSRIADLGCGNAGRLIEICQRYKTVKGIGIDINRDAIALASSNIAANNLNQTIELYCENVLTFIKDPSVKEQLSKVEIVTCFMMLHDLFNVEGLKHVLFDRLRSVFTSVKYFVFADTVRMPSCEDLNEVPIFNVGFELLHSYMDVTIHHKSSYEETFSASGLHIEKCLEFGAPNTYLYLLRA